MISHLGLHPEDHTFTSRLRLRARSLCIVQSVSDVDDQAEQIYLSPHSRWEASAAPWLSAASLAQATVG